MTLFKESGLPHYVVGSASFVYSKELEDYVPSTGEPGEGRAYEGHQHYKYLISDVTQEPGGAVDVSGACGVVLGSLNPTKFSAAAGGDAVVYI